MGEQENEPVEPVAAVEMVPEAEVSEQRAAARDATSWAKSVSRLEVADVPEGATGINVAGRRLAGPIQGFGQLWQKTYQVQIPGALVVPAELVATWKQRFPEFWPPGNRFYTPLTGIAPGEVALIEGTLPGRLKLSTGVMVLYADEESFTLMTPAGHVFAGWITFSSVAKDGATIAQVQLLIRAGDPLFEIGMMLGGHRQEDQFWVSTLTSLARALGVDEPTVSTVVVRVDERRQWRRWTNVFQSSAIGSVAYLGRAPARWLRSRRDR